MINPYLRMDLERLYEGYTQQVIDALQSLSKAGLGSPDKILSKLIHENNRQQSIISEPAIPHNIFREYYFKSINGMNCNNTVSDKSKIVWKKSMLDKNK